MLNFNINDFRQNIKEDHLVIIERMGKNLSIFSNLENRKSGKWMNSIQIQMMDDFAIIKKDIIDSNADMDYQIYCYLVNEYFGGQECEAYDCLSMKNNSRDRMKICNIDNVLNCLDAIHVSLLHGYDTGHKLYESERLILESMTDRMDEECCDLEAEHIRCMISARKEKQKIEMNDMRNQMQMNMNSKFVTVVKAVVDENKYDNNNNEDNDQKANDTKSILYRFGYKFYYHSSFKNNTDIDKHYNGGTFQYCYWYILQKYSSMKEELLKKIDIEIFDDEWKSANTRMDTKYVKEMSCDEYQGHYYDIPENTVISVFHILCLLLYCNLTMFCTAFSKTFRKLSNYETDDSLKARNEEMREFSRLLMECVHVYGTRLSNSKIPIFYHGVSIVMQFPSNVGRFCSPTSTTTGISVAIHFAGTGIVLELVNNNSPYLTFFDCCILSDFSNEAEKLFFQGGFYSFMSDLEYIGMTFNSVRNMQLNENYEYFVIAISGLQVMINGESGSGNKLKLIPKHVKCLRRLMDGNKQCKIPEYVLQMYHSLVNKTIDISILTYVMNLNDIDEYSYFMLFRDVFCELYSAEELEENKEQWMEDESEYHDQGYVQPIIAFKFDLIFNLFPNLNRIEIWYLPLTHRLMEYILNLEIWRDRKRMDIKIEIKRENNDCKKQSDFHGSYNECIAVYTQEFAQKGLIFRLINEGICICVSNNV